VLPSNQQSHVAAAGVRPSASSQRHRFVGSGSEGLLSWNLKTTPRPGEARHVARTPLRFVLGACDLR
jgi:hypothetical protein